MQSIEQSMHTLEDDFSQIIDSNMASVFFKGVEGSVYADIEEEGISRNISTQIQPMRRNCSWSAFFKRNTISWNIGAPPLLQTARRELNWQKHICSSLPHDFQMKSSKRLLPKKPFPFCRKPQIRFKKDWIKSTMSMSCKQLSTPTAQFWPKGKSLFLPKKIINTVFVWSRY